MSFRGSASADSPEPPWTAALTLPCLRETLRNARTTYWQLGLYYSFDILILYCHQCEYLSFLHFYWLPAPSSPKTACPTHPFSRQTRRSPSSRSDPGKANFTLRSVTV